MTLHLWIWLLKQFFIVDNAQYREDMQQTVNEAEVTVSKLLDEKTALAMQLEEEKRKCEDLLFRFEEETVNKDDIQVRVC